MKIKILKMWLGHPVGRVLDLGKGQATELIRQGKAEEVKTEEPKKGRKPQSPINPQDITKAA